MAALYMENIPDELYARLGQLAEYHHLPLEQEVLQCLKAGVAVNSIPKEKPDWEEFKAFMQDAWSLTITDTRTPDEIIGYDANGLFN